jgi:transposase
MKKLNRIQKRFDGLTVGLDLHKRFIEFVIFDRAGDEIDNGRFNATRKDLATFLKATKESQIQFAFEACGFFLWVFDCLAERYPRDRIHVAQAHRIRVIANSMEKNDSNDAWWLGYLLYECRLPEAFVPEGDLRDLRIAVRELRNATNRRSDLIRRFRSHLAQDGKQIPGSDFHTKAARREAKNLAETSKGMRGAALQSLLTQIEFLDEAIKEWRKRSNQLSQAFEEIATIQKFLPGIGPIIAATIYGELGDPRRFYSAKAYAKATGLTPGNRESGGKRAAACISRTGSSLARWAFTRAIISCMRATKGPGLAVRTWAQHRARRQPKKKVYTAAARKIAEGVWRLFVYGECFELKRIFPAG